MSVIIGLDLGTTACKAVALTPDGRVVAAASADYPLRIPQPGWAEQDADDIWLGAQTALHALVRALDGAPIEALALSGAMHSVLALDVHDQPLAPALTWADQRAASSACTLRSQTDLLALYRRTGCPLQVLYYPAKLRWCVDRFGGGWRASLRSKKPFCTG